MSKGGADYSWSNPVKYILVLAAILLTGGCATCPSSLPVRCKDTRPPQEAFPDTAKAVQSVPLGDMEDLSKLVVKGRVMRDERLAEDDALIKICTQAK